MFPIRSELRHECRNRHILGQDSCDPAQPRPHTNFTEIEKAVHDGGKHVPGGVPFGRRVRREAVDWPITWPIFRPPPANARLVRLA